MVVKKNKPKVSIVFKSILGIVILLIVFFFDRKYDGLSEFYRCSS